MSFQTTVAVVGTLAAVVGIVVVAVQAKDAFDDLNDRVAAQESVTGRIEERVASGVVSDEVATLARAQADLVRTLGEADAAATERLDVFERSVGRVEDELAAGSTVAGQLEARIAELEKRLGALAESFVVPGEAGEGLETRLDRLEAALAAKDGIGGEVAPVSGDQENSETVLTSIGWVIEVSEISNVAQVRMQVGDFLTYQGVAIWRLDSMQDDCHVVFSNILNPYATSFAYGPPTYKPRAAKLDHESTIIRFNTSSCDKAAKEVEGTLLVQPG